jgi:hypothetical protein
MSSLDSLDNDNIVFVSIWKQKCFVHSLYWIFHYILVRYFIIKNPFASIFSLGFECWLNSFLLIVSCICKVFSRERVLHLSLKLGSDFYVVVQQLFFIFTINNPSDLQWIKSLIKVLKLASITIISRINQITVRESHGIVLISLLVSIHLRVYQIWCFTSIIWSMFPEGCDSVTLCISAEVRINQ